MKKNNDNIISDLVQIKDNKVYTTSLDVARVFNKRHADVLKTIENLECSNEFIKRNFSLSSYVDSTGRSLPMYIIYRDGFSMLVMSYTGKKAMVWKEKYIETFNKMENKLKQLSLNDRYSDNWLKVRIDGKVVRKELTDIIVEFIEYAKSQGSEHCDFYYVHITNAINNSLFGIKSGKKANKNLRNEINTIQLAGISFLEYKLGKYILKLLSDDCYSYKEIYEKCKEFCINFSNVTGGIEKPYYFTLDEYKKCMDKKTLRLFEKEQNQLKLT